MARAETPVLRDDRRRRVEHLLIAGTPITRIAQAIGVNYKTALHDSMVIRQEWARARIDAYDKHAAEELVRLAKLQEAVWTAAMDVSRNTEPEGGATDLNVRRFRLACVAEARRISDQRSKLLGLYAPIKLDVQDERVQSRSAFEEEVSTLLARLDAVDTAAVAEQAEAALVEGVGRNGDAPA
jgi:hypothetical protein